MQLNSVAQRSDRTGCYEKCNEVSGLMKLVDVSLLSEEMSASQEGSLL